MFLLAAHAIPVHRCAELTEALTGAKPSPDVVHQMIARTARRHSARVPALSRWLCQPEVVLAHIS